MPPSHTKPAVAFLFDDTLDSNDGVAQQVKRLGEWLSRNGHRVVYLCGETKLNSWAGGKVYSLSKNIGVSFNGNRLSMPLASRASVINQVLAAERPDIVHVTVPYSPLMAQRVIARAYKDSVIVGTFHILPSGALTTVGSRLLRLLQWRSLKKFDAMMSVSTSAAEFARANFGLHSTVIPNMVDLASFKVAIPRPLQPGKIVFLGRLVKRKGCAQLIKAFDLLARQNPDAWLVIAGDGPQRPALEKLVSKLGLRGKVSFLGFIPEEDKAGLLSSAAVACFPSLYGESFGVVLIEAMAAGAGVVLAGDNPGYRTVLAARPQLLIDPRRSQKFAARLDQLLRDDGLSGELHVWQTRHVKQYDVAVVAQQVLSVYTQAIAKRAKTGHNERHAA